MVLMRSHTVCFLQKYGKVPPNYPHYPNLEHCLLFTLSIWTQLLEQRADSVDPDQMCEGVHHFPYSNISINGLAEVSSLA